jgi:hypothetical protein
MGCHLNVFLLSLIFYWRLMVRSSQPGYSIGLEQQPLHKENPSKEASAWVDSPEARSKWVIVHGAGTKVKRGVSIGRSQRPINNDGFANFS